MARSARAAVLVALTASVTLLGGFALKTPCLYEPWLDDHQYRTYCYTDIIPLYTLRDLAWDYMPYVEAFNEYPVVTGLVQYSAAVLTSSVTGYFLANALVLLVAGWLATIAMWRTEVSLTRLLAWTASPALLVHAVTSWDLLAVAFATWGWLRWRNGDSFASAVLFGLGGATKLFPAFFLPFLVVEAWRRTGRKEAGWVMGGGSLGLALPNLVVMPSNFDGWLATWRFHADRPPDFETPWAILLEGNESLRTFVMLVTIATMAVAMGALAWGVWRERVGALCAGAVVVGVFLLVNSVYSPQYTLWALPLLVLAGARLALVWPYVFADVGVFIVRNLRFTRPGDGSDWNRAWDGEHEMLVLARWVLLAALLGLLVWERTRASAVRPDVASR